MPPICGRMSASSNTAIPAPGVVSTSSGKLSATAIVWGVAGAPKIHLAKRGPAARPNEIEKSDLNESSSNR